MSISYNVVPNALTNPPSFTTRVAPNLVLDFDEMAVQINLHNPTIPVATAKSVLESFREEVKTQLLNGNTVKLTNFVSFVTTIPVNLTNATDPLPPNSLDIKAKPAATFKVECNNAAQYTRLGYPTKDPSIIEAKDTEYSVLGYINPNVGVQIDGRNIGFDTSDSELGVYLVKSTGVEEKQSTIILNEPSRLIFYPSFTEVGTSYSEMTLLVRNRYTTNGTVRTGTYLRRVRGPVTIANGETNLIFCSGDVTSTAEITGYTDGDRTAIVKMWLDNLNVLNMAARGSSTDWGATVQITAAGAYTIPFMTFDFQVTVGTLQTLVDNVTLYGRYMEEVLYLSTLA